MTGRRGVLVSVTAVASALLLAASSVAAGPAPEDDGGAVIELLEPDVLVSEAQLPEGRYVIRLGLSGSFDDGTGVWRGGGTGTGAMTITAGGGEGTWNYAGSGTYTFDGQSFPSPGSVPEGTITSDGTTITMSGPNVTPPVAFRPSAVSCSVMSGGMSLALGGVLASQGASPSLSGHFVATRVSDVDEAEGGEIEAELERLLASMEDLVEQVRAGDVEDFAGGLTAVLNLAQSALSDLRAASPCADGDASFSSALASYVAELIFLATGDDWVVGFGEFSALVTAGLRTGVLGAGSSNPGLADRLSALLEDTGTVILDEILGPPVDADALGQWLVIADVMGWERGVSSEIIDEALDR